MWDIEERIAERDIEQLKWEMDPLDEVKIGKRSELTYLIKVDKSSASDSGVWLVQVQQLCLFFHSTMMMMTIFF